MDPIPAPGPYGSAVAGALAAGLLREICEASLDARSSQHLEVVREAALDLERQLDALTKTGENGPASAQLLAEGALLCADLATLAACAAPELPGDHRPSAFAATHLAAGAVRALCSLAAVEDVTHDEYVMRDVKSATWRAGLAERQIDESAEG